MLNLLTVTLAILSYIILRGIYNIKFHALRDVPGPWWHRFSSAPRHLAVLRGKHVHLLSTLHLRYGRVVRFAPNEVSYITAQAWKDIYGHGRADQFIKDVSFFGIRPHGLEDILTLQDAKKHARVRKALNPAFSERAAREQEVIVTQYADQLISKIDEKATEGGNIDCVNLSDMFTFATFDIISDLSFGQSLQLLDKGAYVPWVKLILDKLKFGARSGVLQKMLRRPLDKWISALLLTSSKRKAYKHFKFAADLLNKRLQQLEWQRPDIWHFILSKSGTASQEQVLSLSEMHANASVIIVAGSETSTSCLSALSFFIMNNQAIYTELTQEIRTSFRTSSEISFEKLAKLSYLNACISEALRIMPPSAAGLPRLVPPGGESVDGIFLPGGTVVYVSHYAAYRNQANFRDPNSFQPERWLMRDTYFSNDCKEVFQPFSVGPRNCIGQNLAWHEIRLLLAKTLWHYDIEYQSETSDFLNMNYYLTWEKKPLWVKVTPVSRKPVQ